MGFLSNVLGGVVGVEMATVVNGFIEHHGGVQGIVSQLEQQGLGNTVRSWVGTGPNQAVSPAQLQQALDPQLLQQMAGKLGINPQDLLGKLAQALPAAIDHLTPGGVIPKA